MMMGIAPFNRETDMEHYFLSADQEDGTVLCMAPLTSRQMQVSDVDIDDPSGVFLYKQTGKDYPTKVQIIARVLTEEAAIMFQSVFKLA